MPRRIPLLVLNKAEHVFVLEPTPAALLVDLEGTLTEFNPSPHSVINALACFDGVARQNGLDLRLLHYVTNADLGGFCNLCHEFSARLHLRACKPFFTPPREFQLYGHGTFVVGDQYLTDGLLAWRFGFSFGLVKTSATQPLWPRVQLRVGQAVSHLFCKLPEPKR